jgi:hypothetical protein
MMHSRSHSRSLPDHLCATNCRCPHPRLSSPLRSPRYATGPVEIQFAGIWQRSDPPTVCYEFNQRRRQTHLSPDIHPIIHASLPPLQLRHTFVVADATKPDCPLVYASEG